jgi:hypothetical protein
MKKETAYQVVQNDAGKAPRDDYQMGPEQIKGSPECQVADGDQENFIGNRRPEAADD